MPELRFEGVRKVFGALVALESLDLQVTDGELLVLVGPSGSGKTTALRIAAGLEQPTRGSVRIGGRDVTELPPVDRDVAMVFQSHALFPHLTVAENIGFGLAARRVPRAAAEASVRAAAELVDCAQLLDRDPGELSGGERQRVALARALAREPDVFLLDEPLSNLDPQLRARTRVELKQLHRRLEATMLYVTHEQLDAMTLADRVAVLRNGRIEQVGTPGEVYRRPRTRFVAEFLGQPAMNFLAATASDGELRAGPFAFRTPPRGGGATVDVGVRPHHVGLGPPLDGVRARVVLVEDAGDAWFVHLETEADAIPLVARVEGATMPAEGEAVGVSLPDEHAHFFDARSGLALP